MNTKLLRIVSLWLLTATSLLYATDMTTNDYIDAFYKEFSQPMNDGTAIVIARFHKEVPTALQAQVLDQILNRALSNKPTIDYRVMGYALTCIRNFGSELDLTPQLDANLYTLAKDSNWMTRKDVLRVLSKLKRDKDHDVIVAALNDPKDEVRDAAMDALRDRPGSEAVYQKFIQDHRSDTNYTTSVQSAQSGLDAIHEKANGH